MAALKDGCLPAGAQRRIACKNRKWGQVAGKRINELEDKLRGEIKQQIDPAFGVTKTDVQFHVREEAVSKTAMLNPHALVSRPKCFCNPLCGLLPCMCVLLPAHSAFKTCCIARAMTLIVLHGRKAKLGPKMRRVAKCALLNHIYVHGPYFS